MNLYIGLQQGLHVSQQLNLAPQLLSWLKLLQCPAMHLEQMVRQELETNPALEPDMASPGDEPGTGDPETADEPSPAGADDDAEPLPDPLAYLMELNDEWQGDYQHSQAQHNATRQDDEDRQQFIMECISSSSGLQEHLLRQVPGLNLSPPDQRVAEYIIGSLDERGYLNATVEELADMTRFTAARVRRVLEIVQRMEPAGVAARTLGECLRLQMDDPDPATSLAARLADEFLPDLADRNYPRIAEATGRTETEIREAAGYLASLDPQPGARYGQEPIDYITPDIVIRKVGAEYQVELRDEQLPRLRISASCRRLLSESALVPDDAAYVRQKIRAATFLIQGIHQRQETLKKVAREIIRFQRDFLDRPDGQLRPLTMAKVAAVIGVHETTISRALANKYVETPRGLFELKHFFRSGYRCSDGSALTPEAVKDRIVRLVRTESLRQPLTDLDIARSLRQQGLELARRTVAKYREELQIPPSKDRRLAVLRGRPGEARAAAALRGAPRPGCDHLQPALAAS
jgi:RNA polymerase sigma-54 factor